MIKDSGSKSKDNEKPADHFSEMMKNDLPDPLTRIRDMYTLSTTPEDDDNEVNKLMIKQFFYTLAEVAMSVASRKINR